MLVHHGGITIPWGPNQLRDLSSKHLAVIFETPPEVLLIGTGRITSFPHADVLESLEAAHIGFECMDTRSAARTYNILITEGRDVSVAMLPPAA